MKFTLILLFSVCCLYLFHFLIGASSFKHANEVTSLLMGIALIGMILSTACFFMNMGHIQVKKKKIPVIWMVFSVISFLAFTAYIGLCLVERANAVGIAF